MRRYFCDSARSNTFAAWMHRFPPRYLFLVLMAAALPLWADAQTPVTDTVQRPVTTPRTAGADTMVQRDSISAPVGDSLRVDTTAVSRAPIDTRLFLLLPDSALDAPAARVYGSFAAAYIRLHPQVRAAEKPLLLPSLVRKPPDLDWVFYLFLGLLFYLALLRMAFPKYFQDMFRVFLNSSMRQKQIREQLSQEPLPSLMLNIFFVASTGLFLYFLLQRKSLAQAYPSWMVLSACLLLPVAIYLVKYIVLRSLGWVFGKSEAMESYLFMVFLVNKILGMVLLPFTLLMVYASPAEIPGLVWLAVFSLCILAIYRLVRGYSALRKGLRINQLQYLLFVAAFEVVPILLLYKGLNSFF